MLQSPQKCWENDAKSHYCLWAHLHLNQTLWNTKSFSTYSTKQTQYCTTFILNWVNCSQMKIVCLLQVCFDKMLSVYFWMDINHFRPRHVKNCFILTAWPNCLFYDMLVCWEVLKSLTFHDSYLMLIDNNNSWIQISLHYELVT